MAVTTSTLAELTHDLLVDVSPSTTLRGAAELLAAETIGAVLVSTGRSTYGILSERDIVRAVADGVDLDDERVGDHCTEDLLTVPATTSVPDAMRLLRENEIRHLVVRHPDGRLGIVSLRDIAATMIA